MQIDWLTVVAQIVNFLILVWLLTRFLYRPVVEAMDRREQHIAERLRHAAEREQQAAETVHEYRKKRSELDDDRGALIDKAREAAESARLEMLEDARREAAERRAQWQRQVAEERRDFLRALRHQTADAVQSVARRALADLAGRDLEEQIVESFIERLQSTDRDMCHAIAAAGEAITVHTAFELDPSARGRITRAIHEHIREGIVIDYEVSPELICGIEMTAAGRQLSWTLDGYLDALDERMETLLERAGAADA
ncbi:MAG: hypothetical protein R3286_14465 [Gammaproteobacteria bacterium]|nr:hypothetical protein [Gammaproteobacteria bacterium]